MQKNFFLGLPMNLAHPYLPVLLTRVTHEPTNKTNCMCEIRPSANHNIHQTPYCTSLRNPTHVLLLLSSLGCKSNKQVIIGSTWSVYRLSCCHAKPWQNLLNITFLWQEKFLLTSFPIDLHPQNLLRSTQIFHLKFSTEKTLQPLMELDLCGCPYCF